MTPARSTAPRDRAAAPATGAAPAAAGGPRPRRHQLDQLRFLHQVLRLATTARTWDELLETVVDGTRDALHARRLLPLPARPRRSVPDAGGDERARPLPDRPGAGAVRRGRHRPRRRVARAAGHPRRQGRPALPVGPRHRPAPVRRLDAVGAAHLARPDRRGPQRPDRASRATSARPTSTSSARSRTCSPASSRRAASSPRPRRGSRRSRPSTRRAASSSPSSPTSCAPRSPSSAPTPTCWPRSRRSSAASRATSSGARRGPPWHRATLEQIERLDRLVDSILASVRVVPGGPGRRRARSTSRRVVGEVLDRAPAAARQPPARRPADAPACRPWPTRRGSARSSSTSSRTPSSTPRPRRPSRIDWDARRGRRPARRQRRGPGHPRGVARADLRAVRPPRHPHRPRLRHRPVRRQATRRIDGRPPVVRAGATHGARFVVALPAAVAV